MAAGLPNNPSSKGVIVHLRKTAALLAGLFLAHPLLAAPDTAPVALSAAATPAGVMPVQVSAAALQAARCRLDLGDLHLTLVRDRLVAGALATRWEGHLESDPHRHVVLEAGADGMTGALDLPGMPLRLGHANHRQWLLPAVMEELAADVAPEIFLPRALSTSAADVTPGVTPGGLTVPASAPDKPADVAFPVSLNLAQLANLAPGQQAVLATDQDRYQVTYDQSAVSPDGHTTWMGHLSQYGNDYPVTLTYGPDGSSTGTIMLPQGELLLAGRTGNEWLVDTAASGIRHNPTAKDGDAMAPALTAASGAAAHAAAGGVGQGVAQGGATAGSTGTTAPAPATAAGTTTPTTTTTTTTVDVLVLYTPGLVTRYGGASGAANRIAYFIATANKAYADSGVAMTLRLVGTQQVSLSDTTTNAQTLNDLGSAAGPFAGIPALRNKLGADGVVLVRPFYMNGQGGNCGIAWVGGYNLTPIKNSSESAYAVVSEGTDMGHSAYYCTDYTFAHELGHNMGLMHDRATVASQGGGVGALPYAYGYGRQGTFGTIMSYDFPVVGRFSNPADKSCASGPCGVVETDTANSANNVKALGLTKDAFAGYRGTVTASQVSVAGVVTVDGKAASGIAVTANGSVCATTAANGAYACTFAPGYTGTLSLLAPAHVTFTPPSVALANVQASTTQNFSGVTAPVQPQTVTVSGAVTVNGKAAAGTVVKAGTVACTVVAASGAYSCTLAYGFTGNLTVSVGSQNFPPLPLKNLTVSETVNFTAQTSTGKGMVLSSH